MANKSKVRSAVRRVPGAQGLAAAIRRPAGLDAQLMNRLDRQQRQLGNFRLELAALSEHLPNLLNTIASQHGAQRTMKRQTDDLERRLAAFIADISGHVEGVWRTQSDHAVAISDLWSRLELIRREILLEMRYSPRPAESSPAFVTPKILNVDKVDAAKRDVLRVNVGCGHIPMDGYVNVDVRQLPGVDVLAAADNLPFSPSDVHEVFSAHLIEHFPQEMFLRTILPHWVGLLAPGGVLRAVLPDAGAMLAGFAANDISYSDLREVLFGGQEYEGDFHFNMYTASTLSEFLENAGLVDVVVEAAGRHNGACLEMQLSAHLPE